MKNQRAGTASERKLFVLCLFIVGLPLGVGLLLNRINAPPRVSMRALPAPPKPNGFDFYVAAAKAMVPAKPAVDALNDPQDSIAPELRASRYSLARKNAWLGANAAGLRLFERARKTPALAPPVPSFATQLFYLPQLRQLALDKAVQSNARWMRGDYPGALESALDNVQMGHDIRRGGALMVFVSGTNASAVGRWASHDTVEKLDAATSGAAARRLERLLDNRWSLTQTVQQEKWTAQSGWLEFLRRDDWRSIDFSGDLTDTGPFVWGKEWGERVQIQTISKQRIMDDLAALYDFQIAVSRLPYARRAAQVEPSFPGNPYTRIFGVDLDQASFRDARDLAGDHSLMLRLALRAYRLENGASPPNLNALTPKYLNAIPADPFGNGELWRYKVSGQTYVLWSIGPDGRDDGGTPIVAAKAPPRFAGERAKLPNVLPDSRGDYVAGRNG